MDGWIKKDNLNLVPTLTTHTGPFSHVLSDISGLLPGLTCVMLVIDTANVFYDAMITFISSTNLPTGKIFLDHGL